MAAKKVGVLIKEARTNAGLSQEKLAAMIPGLSASEISKAERGEKDLTQEELKAIARATGVTQKSLLEAAGSRTSSSSSSISSSSGTRVNVTASEKKLLELYRAADSETKKKVLRILKGETTDGQELLGNLIEGALEQLIRR